MYRLAQCDSGCSIVIRLFHCYYRIPPEGNKQHAHSMAHFDLQLTNHRLRTATVSNSSEATHLKTMESSTFPPKPGLGQDPNQVRRHQRVARTTSTLRIYLGTVYRQRQPATLHGMQHGTAAARNARDVPTGSVRPLTASKPAETRGEIP